MSVSYERKSKRNDESLKTVFIAKWIEINFKTLNFRVVNIKLAKYVIPYKLKISLIYLFKSDEN
jgi:hypothetical protein